VEAVAAGDVCKLVESTEDRRYQAATLLAADAGLRIGEIQALRWLDINELMRELSIEWSYDRTGELTETKGWKRRVVSISDRLWSALQALKRVGPLVFCRRDSKPLGYDVTRDGIRDIYLHAGVKVPRKPWHSLRHTFGTELANATFPFTSSVS
jgi:integrase